MEAILANLLAPFLVHLVRAGQRAGTDAAGALASGAGRLAREVWERLRDDVEQRPAAKEAVEDVAAAPADELALGALQLQLRKVLREDPALREELAALLEEGQRRGVVREDGGVNFAGDVRVDRGSILAGRDITGDIDMRR